jgi:hypothetical protein
VGREAIERSPPESATGQQRESVGQGIEIEPVRDFDASAVSARRGSMVSARRATSVDLIEGAHCSRRQSVVGEHASAGRVRDAHLRHLPQTGNLTQPVRHPVPTRENLAHQVIFKHIIELRVLLYG